MSPMFKGVLWLLGIMFVYGVLLPFLISAKSTIASVVGIFIFSFFTAFLAFKAWSIIKNEIL
jgi:hypothetical protein